MICNHQKDSELDSLWTSCHIFRETWSWPMHPNTTIIRLSKNPFQYYFPSSLFVLNWFWFPRWKVIIFCLEFGNKNTPGNVTTHGVCETWEMSIIFFCAKNWGSDSNPCKWNKSTCRVVRRSLSWLRQPLSRLLRLKKSTCGKSRPLCYLMLVDTSFYF